ncbi:hypothetical protein VNI00_004651 [Paramarasmius palmivorus]|uniref:Uncharacterized protein n=1 Tax=Paramarasmius palmivorus TaxID=297713 RepID=A0AAW0DJ65_9AGAR
MSNMPENIGTTLANGIQDVSALLPLLGTEQVECHVGSALEKGYLYAAASNLSLFGSLGSAKAAFATCVGTITHRRFYGGQWLDNAGFSTAGSVTSMVTIDKDTGLYGAEVKLKKLLEEQHINDPNLISGFEWSGWRCSEREYDVAAVLEQWNTWNWRDGGQPFLHYWGFVTSDLWEREYHEVVHNVKGAVKRFIGFQIPHIIRMLRIHHITNTSLEWMKVRYKKTGVLEETHGQKVLLLEQRVCEHLVSTSLEEAQEEIPEDTHKSLEHLLAINPLLITYQLLIATGMAMIIVGYVGCFSIVKNSDAPAGPYIWFGMEAFLSLLRMVLWGSNPSWDESTGLTMKLKLHNSQDSYYPLITSPYDSAELGFVEKLSSPKPFTVFSEAEFFAMATSWIGPIQQLGANAITLYYALLPCQKQPTSRGGSSDDSMMYKELCVTVLLSDSRSFTFLCCKDSNLKDSITVFSSKLEKKDTQGSSSYHQVLLADMMMVQENDGFLQSPLFTEVINHAQSLCVRISSLEQKNLVHLTWNLNAQTNNPTTVTPHALLSSHDTKYIGLRQLWDYTYTHILDRHSMDQHSDTDTVSQDRSIVDFHYEIFLIFEITVLEVYIWGQELDFLEIREQDSKLRLQLYPECSRAMETRMERQRTGALQRYQKYVEWSSPDSIPSEAQPQELSESRHVQLRKTWDHLLDTLQRLRNPRSTDNIHQKTLQEECLYHLSLALEYMPAAPPSNTVPYIAINSFSAIPYIQRMENLCAFEISLFYMNKKSFREHLSSIIYPNQNTTYTTTLILRSFDSNSSDLKSALTDHIIKHPNILCLAGLWCHRPGESCEEPHCKAILTNQEAWKNSVEKGSGFMYWVGFEGYYGMDVQAKGDYIQLWNTGRALVLFYAPSGGEVTVMLSVHNRHDQEIELQATLKLDVDRRPAIKTQKVFTGQEKGKDKLQDVVFVFSVVQEGVREITIEAPNNCQLWGIYGLVEVQWKSANIV